jgi:DNA-binding transcriptional MerR regulator
MTASTRLRDLVDNVSPEAPLPPLTEELVRSLDLPADLGEHLNIAQVAELTGTTAHTLRYYERIGLVRVGRDALGHRAYDREALGRIVFVTRLRSSDMPIRAVVRYVELVEQGAHTQPERLALLEEHRDAVRRRLVDLQFALAVVDYKIAAYGGACGV